MIMGMNLVQKMALLYQQGNLSLQEAAYQANISLDEMMDYIQNENIRPPPQSKEEIQSEIKKSKHLVRKLLEN